MRMVPGYGLLACPAAEETVVDEEERTASEILQTETPAEMAIAPTAQPSQDPAEVAIALTAQPSQDLGRLSSGVKVTHS